MTKSVLYAANTTAQTTVATGTTIDFGRIIRRYGSNINVSGGNVITMGVGYYDFDANVTFIASGAGTATIQLYKDGIAIPGASASFTTESATRYAVSIPFITKDRCCCESTITASISGVAGSVINASVTVTKE